jgi:hypothetical protein
VRIEKKQIYIYIFVCLFDMLPTWARNWNMHHMKDSLSGGALGRGFLVQIQPTAPHPTPPHRQQGNITPHKEPLAPERRREGGVVNPESSLLLGLVTIWMYRLSA